MSTTELARTVSAPYPPGTAGYRRVMVAMFLAGMSTFVLLYDVQALLPELVEAYAVTPTRATLTLSLTTPPRQRGGHPTYRRRVNRDRGLSPQSSR